MTSVRVRVVGLCFTSFIFLNDHVDFIISILFVITFDRKQFRNRSCNDVSGVTEFHGCTTAKSIFAAMDFCDNRYAPEGTWCVIFLHNDNVIYLRRINLFLRRVSLMFSQLCEIFSSPFVPESTKRCFELIVEWLIRIRWQLC